MKIGYMRLGRSIMMSDHRWSHIGGDAEVIRLLRDLAERNPQHEFIVLGKNTGGTEGLPSNVTNPWDTWKSEVETLDFSDRSPERDEEVIQSVTRLTNPIFAGLDGIICWLGQHGAASTPIPKSTNRSQLTRPLVSQLNYCAYIIRGINLWQNQNPDRDVVWLNPDHRNVLKSRDLKWPLQNPVLAQFNDTHNIKHERYEDPTPPPFGVKAENGLWKAKVEQIYSGLELTGVPGPTDLVRNSAPGEIPFGMVVNDHGGTDRFDVLKDWVIPNFPIPDVAEVWGKWSDERQKQLGIEIQPLKYADYWKKLRQFRTTLFTPAAGWPTARAWETFGSGVVGFMHPGYDTQGHVIPTRRDLEDGKIKDDATRYLVAWLRLTRPQELRACVEALCEDTSTWRWLVQAQRELYERRWNERRCVKLIEERLGV